MPNWLLRILSHEWVAIGLGLMLSVPAVFLGRGHPGYGAVIAVVLLPVVLVLIIGGTIHVVRIRLRRRANPPAGKLIDVGGYRLHVFAQGSNRGNPSIVWLGGGHAAGTVMVHLHERLVNTTRSILVDRPGTGWSDTGPFPRTTAREAEEVIKALAGAGEPGPFVLAGYSFGGLLAANIARRYPQSVATLVLLDPTPLETIVFGPRLGALGTMRREALMSGLLRLIGIPADLSATRIARTLAYAPMRAQFEAALGPALAKLREIECTAGSQFAHYSIYQELSPEGVAACGWETVVYDGDLGEMPVVLVAPATADEVTVLPEVAGASGIESARMQRFFARTRERYLATSRRSRRLFTPDGTTHQFCYETPEFVTNTVREILAGLRDYREEDGG